MSDQKSQLIFTFLDTISIILPFYLIYSFIAPRFLVKSKKIIFFLTFSIASYLSGLVLTGLMKLALNKSIFTIKFDFKWDYNSLVFNRYFIVFLGAFAGFITKLSVDWLKNQKRIVQLEKENTIAELSNLKSQINPHFLFNILNTIYIQVETSPDKARQSIHSLSHLLHYQFNQGANEKVALEMEIAYMEDYILLQRSRLEEIVEVNFIKTIDNAAYTIAPLILITFVENSFKHFAANNVTPKINIELFIKKGNLFFNVINSSRNIQNEKDRKRIGIMNVKRRLELLYPGKYSLRTEDMASTYYVELKINLK
ncbi:MAG: histidine kinase [Ferruginibacter sp.]